jgi:hypothetical protein
MAKSEQIVNTAAQPSTVTPQMITEGFMQQVRQSTKDLLAAQQKFTIRLSPAKKNEPKYEIVGVNGYNYQIERGKSVEVPETVYNILVEAELI